MMSVSGRLWKRGQLQERYFIVLVKNSNYIRKAAKVPLKIPSVTTKKSIKFDNDNDDNNSPNKTADKASQGSKTKLLPKDEDSVESILAAIRKLEEADSGLTTVSEKKIFQKANTDRIGGDNSSKRKFGNGQPRNKASQSPNLPKKKRF
jgi:hypothetical protein